jgi:hypothetical protein
MFARFCSLLILTLSVSAFAIPTSEMEMKVNNLQLLRDAIPGINVEAYVRELNYEKQEIPHEKRAEIEANKIGEELRRQIYALYQEALERSGDKASAHEEMKLAIENDLQLIDPELQDEFRTLSLEALTMAESGAEFSSDSALKSLEQEMLKASLVRSLYLNTAYFSSIDTKNKLPVMNGSKDAEKTEYNSRRELVAALVSDQESSSWFNTAGQDIDSEVSTYSDGDISFRFKTRFLGVAVEAGPVIKVHKEISTSAHIVAEGHYPLIMANGSFDFAKRDQSGRKLVKNGKTERRFAAFYCDARLNFTTDYNGAGSFTYMGIGGSVSRGRSVSDSVTMDSRQLFLPEYVDHMSVTMPLLRQICHNDYLKAKVSPKITLKQSMDINMKNLLAGAVFIHPKTKCAVDNHCINWFKKEKLSVLGNRVYPRCVEDRNEKYRTCIVASRSGQACPVHTKGKLVSRGVNEYICDRGLKCVKVKEEGPLWLQYAQGVCKPAVRNYKAPPIIR